MASLVSALPLCSVLTTALLPACLLACFLASLPALTPFPSPPCSSPCRASILWNIRKRFFTNRIYTATGPILIAVNPYQWLDIYRPETMHQYRDASARAAVASAAAKALGSKGPLTRGGRAGRSAGGGGGGVDPAPPLPPHCFSLAEDAYAQLRDSGCRDSASIIICECRVRVAAAHGKART